MAKEVWNDEAENQKASGTMEEHSKNMIFSIGNPNDGYASKGGGQILICVAGEGWYQEEGKEARSLKPGDVVNIPANVKHWHGAKKNSWFSHLAMECPGEECSNKWCDVVSDEEYAKLS